MIDILNKIAEHKKKEVSNCKKLQSIEGLKGMPLYQRPTFSAKQAILNSSTGIIAEFKRKSPSKPTINLQADPHKVIQGYAQEGAAAVSILTDEFFFGGDINFIQLNRDVQTPLLRKDFIIDTYQIHEAKAYGADFILLIAAILSEKQIITFTDLAHELNLEVLLEFHAGEELTKLYEKVDMVGINNRNLRTFEVNIANSIKMREALGNNHICITESGIHSVLDYVNLRDNGFEGFLIGEYFMKHNDPGVALASFINEIESS